MTNLASEQMDRTPSKGNTAFNEDDLDSFCNEAIMYYSEEIIERVKGVVSYQLNKGE